VINGFLIESDVEPILPLEPGQEVPLKYVTWDPSVDILNDRIGQRFGPTLFREGLLLAQGLKSPALARKQRWAYVTVSVVDQFERCYDKRVPVAVHDVAPAKEKGFVAKPRRSVFENEDEQQITTRRAIRRVHGSELPGSRQLDKH
jgi:hypothetical protein